MATQDQTSPGVGNLLEACDLHVAYDKVDAVAGVTLEVRPGEIVTVIGPNGAGKTTLLAALMGVVPSRGSIVIEGEAAGQRVSGRISRGMALVPESRALFAGMTVEDNLVLGSFRSLRKGGPSRRDELARIYDLFPRLMERRGQLASTLSGGERQMLALGRALMGRPRLLMLDEPSLGLAPLIVRDIFRIISELRRSGVAILLVEQNARAALRVADRGYVLELGRIVLAGAAEALMDDPKVIETYLGTGSRHQDLLAS